MSIYCITGEPGAGKSALGYKLAGMYCKWDKRPVLSTYDMDWYGVKLAHWSEMYRAENAVCIVDEAADLFHARNFSDKEQIAQLGKFREHRKDGLTLFLIVQDFATLDTNIRNMVRFVWHIKRLFGPDFYENETPFEKRWGVWSLARLFLAKSYLTESKKFQKSTQLFRIDSLYGRFDTLAKSAGRKGTASVRGSGIANGRRSRHEAAHVGEIRPDVVMPFSREEYAQRRQLLYESGCGSGVVRWIDEEDVLTQRLNAALEVPDVAKVS